MQDTVVRLKSAGSPSPRVDQGIRSMPTSVPTSARAFPSTPRVDRYFASETAEAARRRLTECVERGEGPALVIGAAGCGKTMLLEVLAKTFADRLRVVRLAGAQVCTRRAMLQAVLHGLGEAYHGLDDGEMRLALADSFSATEEPPVTILVDEAQALPVRLLDELRLMAATVVDGEPRVMLVLAGTNTLDEAFTSPDLDSFNQRIAARCYLSPLTRSESIQYVRAHVAAVGGDPDALFTPDAYDALFQATDGTPRLLNQLGDRALVLAVERGEQLVTGDAIQEAWSDLHQLPAPWHTPSVTPPAFTEEALPHEEVEPAIAFQAEETPAEEPEADAVDQPRGVWNADEGLDLAARSVESRETIDSACVSYAFPTRPVEPIPTPVTPTPTPPPAAEPEAADETDAPEPTPEDTADEPLASDPFDEAFDDEEVVLDRYSKLEAVLRPGVARVENRREVEFGRMFEALTPAVESLIDDVESTLDDAAADSGFSVVSSEPPIEPLEDEFDDMDVDFDDEEPLLVIEEDEPESAGDVARRDYTRLFSSLRQA